MALIATSIMRRGLIEAVEFVLGRQPELANEEQLRVHFTELVSRCIIAVHRIRTGASVERELSLLIYQRDVPKTTLEKLMTRTQRALEQYADGINEHHDANTPPGLWMSVLQLHSTGVQAYFANQSYRSSERLSSVMSTATDPYMLPIAISSGMLLMMQQSRSEKHSKVLATIRRTQAIVDSFTDCWEWMALSAELVAITRRKYKFATFHPRLIAIDTQLQQLLDGGVGGMSPQARMIAATCAYVVAQYLERPESLVQWADIYKQASQLVMRNSPVYQQVLTHMYLRAYTLRHDHEQLVPLLRQLLQDSAAGPTTNPTTAVYATWLAASLLALGRYQQALQVLRSLHPDVLRHTNDNTRTAILLQRSIATGMVRDLSAPVDRRVLRLAVLQNESSQRRLADHTVRVGALLAMLLHCRQRDVVYAYTSDMIAEKLVKLLENHDELRKCRKTSAFVQLVELLEFHDLSGTISKRRKATIDHLLMVISDSSIRSSVEVVPFQPLIHVLYGSILRRIAAEPHRSR